MKNFVKFILFILLGIFIWHCVFKVLWIEENGINSFYEDSEIPMDVIFLGASNAFWQFNTVLAFHEYGFATGMLATGGQSFVATEFLLKEAQKYQNPNVYVIDINNIAVGIDFFEEGIIRKVTDNMKFSKNKLDTIETLLKYTPLEKDEYINYYLSFLTYHNSWKSVNINNFKNMTMFKGYFFDSSMIENEPFSKTVWCDNEEKIDDNNEEVLLHLIDYIKENKLEVLFIIPPRTFGDSHCAKLNYAKRILEENDFKVLNFSEGNEMNIDFQHDLVNEAHLNVYGATKYTVYLGNYLSANYHLKKHTNDNKYLSWQNEYERFKDTFKEISGTDFESLVQEAS